MRTWKEQERNEDKVGKMGLKAELDRKTKRYIYYLTTQSGEVLYVGTSINPKARYTAHKKKIKENSTALIYRYINANNITPHLKIVEKHIGTYATAEHREIQHIIKHQNTVLNFYNNPNKKRYNTLNIKISKRKSQKN